jgi:hypothetical protein
MSKYFKLLEQI